MTKYIHKTPKRIHFIASKILADIDLLLENYYKLETRKIVEKFATK